MKAVLLRTVIGEVLREQRALIGMTLREVAHEARVSLGYLSEVERGFKEPSSELLASIVAALGLTLSDLLQQAADRMARHERPELAAVA